MEPEWEHAVRQGNADAVTRLLAAGADINALDRYGQTALMLAAHAGHREVVEALVRQGAELDRTAKHHLSALMLAALGGHLEIVRILAQAGADVNIRGTGPPGFDSMTAIDLAIGQGRTDIAEVLQGPLDPHHRCGR